MLSRTVRLDPFAALGRPLRPRRLPQGRCRAHAHASRARDPLPAARRARDPQRGPLRLLRPGRRLVRGGPDPVFAAASAHAETAFVRVLLLPAEWQGKRTIRYVDPADEDKPKLAARDGVSRAPDRAPGMRRRGGEILVDQLVAARRRARLRRARRELPRHPGRARRLAVRYVTCRHEVGAANMAEAHGEAHRPPGRVHGHPRPGRDPRRVRRPHGLPGLDAAGAPRRPGRARRARSARRSRRSTTAACSARWRSGSRRSSPRTRIPELVARAFAVAAVGPPGPGRAGAARGRARRGMADVAGRVPRSSPRQRHPGADDLAAAARAARRRRSARSSIVGRTAAGAKRTRDLTRWCEASGLPVAAAWRCQDYVDNQSTVVRAAISRSAPTRGSPRACARPTSCSSSGARLGDIETGGYTLPRRPRAAADAGPRPSATRRSSGASSQPTLAIVAGRAAGGRGARGARAARAALGGVDGLGARRLRRQPAPRAVARRRRPGRGDGAPARAPAGRRDRRHRRRQLHRLGAPVLRVPPLPHAARPDERRHGLRRARRGRRQDRPSRSGRSSASRATATS